MFDNIGGKIKALAKFITWLGIAGSAIAGIAIISSGSQMPRYYGDNTMAIPGLLTIVLGSLFSWLGSFLLYGFGELIEQTTMVNQNLSKLQSDPWHPNEKSSPVFAAAEPEIKPEQTKAQAMVEDEEDKIAVVDRSKELLICPFCGTTQQSNRNICFSCGAKFVTPEK